MKNNFKLNEIYDGYYFATDKNLKVYIDEDQEKGTQVGIHVEILNMLDATGESEFKDYPYLVSMSLCVVKPNKSFDESDDNNASPLSLIQDCISYMGGVPIDHVLQDAIDGGLAPIAKEFSVGQAVLKSHKSEFGTIAAQHGPDHEYQYLQFKTDQDALRFAELLLKRAPALQVMIGFILDRPVNMMGETGWNVIEKQINGCK